MSQRTLLAIMLVLAFLGLADAWYLAQSALTDTALTCGIEALDQCNTVAQSEYSRLLGIPLAVYGVAFYVFFFVLVSIMLAVSRPWLPKVLFWASVVGVFASLYFLYVQVFLIKALCVYCLLSFVLSTLLFIAAYFFRKRALAQALPVVP